MHTLLYRLWAWVPAPVQYVLQYLLSPKATVGVSALVTRDDGLILVVRHTYRRPSWGFPSGMVGRGEQPEDALRRELDEELGVRATVATLLYADHDAIRRHLTLYYRVAMVGTPRQDGVETDAYQYIALRDLAALTGQPTLPWLLEHL